MEKLLTDLRKKQKLRSVESNWKLTHEIVLLSITIFPFNSEWKAFDRLKDEQKKKKETKID